MEEEEGVPERKEGSSLLLYLINSFWGPNAEFYKKKNGFAVSRHLDRSESKCIS
jgi:hypothetical protein